MYTYIFICYTIYSDACLGDSSGAAEGFRAKRSCRRESHAGWLQAAAVILAFKGQADVLSHASTNVWTDFFLKSTTMTFHDCCRHV